jgi:hypothetical protein
VQHVGPETKQKFVEKEAVQPEEEVAKPEQEVVKPEKEFAKPDVGDAYTKDEPKKEERPMTLDETVHFYFRKKEELEEATRKVNHGFWALNGHLPDGFKWKPSEALRPEVARYTKYLLAVTKLADRVVVLKMQMDALSESMTKIGGTMDEMREAIGEFSSSSEQGRR